MDHVTRGDEIINASNTHEQDEDRRDAMEVDGAPSMMIDSSHSHDNESTPVETNTPASPMVTTTTEELPNPDLGSSSSDAPRGSREPPVFDEDTERPRQRRRYHVTVEDENDTAIRAEPVTNAPIATEGTSTVNDEVAVLEAAPPRLSDLSIHSPRSSTPPAAEMQDVLPTAPSANRSPQSPHLGTVPLPDVPPPPRDPNAPPDPVMEAARRLTSAPDGNSDQMQADLALLAPYIAAQAMAAAFQPGGRPPGNPGANQPNQANAPPNGPQPPQEGQGGANNTGPPPLPPLPFGFPFMFGNTERPADPKRAERLANGLKVVEDGLLKRWNAVCGEEGAVCAVCYSELLEEPGIEKEKDKGKAKEEDEKVPEEQPKQDDGTGDEAHERALREALERREQMERLEKEERERKLETAVLAFPCAHVFHRTCLLPWLSRHTTCPTCRFDIDPKSDTLTLPADDGTMPFSGPNGFNFGDFFTVGPVLRVPRAQAPNLGPRPMAGTRRAERNAESRREPGNPAQPSNEQPPNENGEPRPAGEPAANPAPPPSMADLFDGLFGSLFESAGIPTPRRSNNNNNAQTPAAAAQAPPAEASSAQEQVPQEPAAQASAPEQETEEATAETSTAQPPPPDPGATDPSSLDDPLPLRARPSAPIPTDYRPIDYSRPLAMFGRPSPRRPPQPITPAWMRTPRPPVAVNTSSATEASGSASSSPTAETPRASSSTTPTESAPRTSDSTDGSRGFGQLRSIVSNLLPRRLNSNRRASSSAPSIRSTGSNESTGPPSASQTGVRSVSGPLPPRTGIRAILHGPTAMLRDLASRRPADPEGSNTARDSVDSVPSDPPRASVDDDMPELENETEDGSMYSEDDAHRSEEDEDDDMPALEPVGPRAPRTATTSSNDQAAAADNSQPPPLVPRPAQRPAPPLRSASRRATDPPRPTGEETANNMMENIITLRIDLGHADGRDETIIVPLLFNPNGRADQANRGPPRPAAAQPPPSRARTPPPQKKWVPPEPIKTFRQVVEEKEREAGWRCDDPACLLGPADDEEPSDEHVIKPMYSIMRSLSPEDEPVRYKIEDGIRVYAGGEDVRVKGENPVCAHQLHPECLVTSARVNGWGPDHNNKSSSRVTLRCPMCRLEGTVERDVWEAGVEAENAEA